MRRRSWLGVAALLAGSVGTGLAPRRALTAAGSHPDGNGAPATHVLPLFPLGVVAFPGERVALHVFEPRYLQLINECAENEISFGIVTIVSGGASSVGTEMVLDRIVRSDESGTMDVIVRGLRVFHLHRFQRVVEGKLYSAGQVSFTRNSPVFEPEIQSALVQLYNRMQYRYGSTTKIAAPYPENLSFLIAHQVGLSQAQELQLLTMSVERDRQAYLLQHLLRAQ